MSAEVLAHAIDEANKDAPRASASALAVSVAGEDGLTTAVTAIENLMRWPAHGE